MKNYLNMNKKYIMYVHIKTFCKKYSLFSLYEEEKILMEENKYGYCTRCGAELRPIWFTDEEYKMENGRKWKTGRTRTACSHLECTVCFKNYAVDDTFDSPWK